MHEPVVSAAAQAQVPPRASSAAERWQLAAWAVGGSCAFQFFLLLPWAFSLGMGALVFNRVEVWWLAGAAMLFLAWLHQPSTRLQGRELRRDEVPQLFHTIDELRQALRTPRIDTVLLTDDFNASAAELGRGFSLRPTRRVLLLGQPLLSLLDEQALRAVMAHELAHFSHRHGRLGHWVYRTRLAWLHLTDSNEDDSLFDRAATGFARRFAPWFSQRSFVYSRTCEFEADRAAADVIGRVDFARALQRTTLAIAIAPARALAGLRAMQAEHAEPPQDLTVRRQHWYRTQPPSPREREQLWAEPPRADDTHPTLRERCQALGVALDAKADDAWITRNTPCAGEALLGPSWHTLVGEADAACRRQLGQSWGMWHAVQAVLRSRLASPDAAKLSRAERLRLEALMQSSGTNAEIAASVADDASTEANYLVGRSLLRQGNRLGIDLLRQCIDADASWAAAARAALHQLGEGQLADDEQLQNLALLGQARERRGVVAQAARERLLDGRFGTPMGPGASTGVAVEALAAALRACPSLHGAWCFAEEVMLDERRRYPVCVLLLRVDPRAAERAGTDEDGIAELGGELLSALWPANVVPVVHTVFTTEAMPASFEAALAGAARARLR